MSPQQSDIGFSLVEVIVATALLSAVALTVTQTLVSALHTGARNEQWMHATELAAEGIELLRAGHTLRPLAPGVGFQRSGVVTPWDGHTGLQRLEVTIAWDDGEHHTFQLTTLVLQ
jgi:type II secretory pathway pseudopilin PulG